MTKLARLGEILDLFTDESGLLTAEDIARLLDVSRPTAFRYVRELSEAGFLANYAGSYSLGARIMTLDYRIRESDPLLRTALPHMQALCREIVATTVLCRMFNYEIINVHQEDIAIGGSPKNGQGLERGRLMPLFRGSPGKTMLANLPQAKLRRIYESHADRPDVRAIGATWDDFWTAMKDIRRQKYFVSIAELNEGTVGISVPITLPYVGSVAVLSIVLPIERLPIINTDGLGQRLIDCGETISAELEELTSSASSKSKQGPEDQSDDETPASGPRSSMTARG